MKTQKIIIKKRRGKPDTVRGNGDTYSLRLNSGEIVNGRMQPTFRHKLWRFIKRLYWTLGADIDRALDALEREAERREKAADSPYIGMEDCQREVERVIVLGASNRNRVTEVR